jgi:hypothetical protein
MCAILHSDFGLFSYLGNSVNKPTMPLALHL